MKLELSIMAGAESKAFLADLTKIVERMEKAAGRSPKQNAADLDDTGTTSDDAPEAVSTEDDEDFAPKAKKAAKKTAAAFEEEEEEPAEVEEAEEEEEADFTAPAKKAPAKAAKPKKVTIDDVNDAAKAKAKSIGGKPGREKVLAILSKKFKVESISELDPSQYEACIAALAV